MDLLQQLRSKRDELITQIDGLTSADDFDPSDKDFVEARSQAEALDSKIKAITELQASRAAANDGPHGCIADRRRHHGHGPVLRIGVGLLFAVH